MIGYINMLRVSLAQNAHLFLHPKRQSVAFMGIERQRHYLNAFHNMESGAQRALMDIYQQAHHQNDREKGRHVIMAMVASVRYTELFRFTVSNIVIRMMLKRFWVEKDLNKALQMQEVLDDFHHALDEFVLSKNQAKNLAPQTSDNVYHFAFTNGSEIPLKEVEAFRNRSASSVAHAKRAGKAHISNPL